MNKNIESIYPNEKLPNYDYIMDIIEKEELPNENLYNYIKNSGKKRNNDTVIDYYGRTITYNKEFDIVDKIANSFKNMGINCGDVVMLIMPNTPETIFCILALNKIGAVCNIIEPRVPSEVIKKFVDVTNPKLMVITDNFDEKIIPIRQSLPDIVRLPIISTFSLKKSLEIITKKIKNEPDKLNILQMMIDDKPYDCISWNDFIKKYSNHSNDNKYDFDKDMPAIYLNSGGTSGEFKLVSLSHYSFTSLVHQLGYSKINLSRGNSILGVMPLFSSYGLGCGLYTVHYYGVKSNLFVNFTPADFTNNVINTKSNIVIGVPSFFVDMCNKKMNSNVDLSFIKDAITGGDIFPTEYYEKVKCFLETSNSNAKIENGAGMTEYSGCITVNDKGNDTSAGYPLLYSKYKIVDPITKEILPLGNEGQIHYSGPGQMIGYVNNEKKNNEFFYYDTNGTKWGISGDLGYMNKCGKLVITGREKDIIVRPDCHKLDAFKAENALSESEIVEKVKCIGIPVADGVGAYGILCIKLADGEHASEETKDQLFELLIRNLPFRDIPIDIVFVDDLMYTQNAKVDVKNMVKSYIDCYGKISKDYILFRENHIKNLEQKKKSLILKK